MAAVDANNVQPDRVASPEKILSDPLTLLPAPLMNWAKKKGLGTLLRRYGWSICQVCGRTGIYWSTELLPQGKKLEWQSRMTGWIHPPGIATDPAWGMFGILWKQIEDMSNETGASIDQIIVGHEQELFHNFMTAVVNTGETFFTFDEMMKGATNPYDFCVYRSASFGKRQGGKHGACPKCGEPGTGEGVVGNERRFFHSRDRSCYIGMINPVRKRNPEVKCPKCGELGRESVSKGFKYIRHEKTTHYIGKVSDQNDIQQVESSDERILTKPHAVESNSLESQSIGGTSR